MNSIKNIIIQFKWFVLLLVTLGLNSIFSLNPHISDNLYYRGIFRVVRVSYDYLLGWLPIPMVYVLFILLFPLMYWIFISPIRRRRKAWKLLLMRAMNFVSITIVLFYFLWGFNYTRPRLVDSLHLDKVEISNDTLLHEIKNIEKTLLEIRLSLKDTFALEREDLPASLEKNIREALEEILTSWDYETYGRVRVRRLSPKGVLLRLSTAGVYIPFVCEGHIDNGLHPIQHPFTMAHEMAHGYGFTNEGECNFIGLVTCLNAENAFIQYSGLLGYYRYLLGNYRRYNPKDYGPLFYAIPQVLRQDIININEELDKYPDILPEFRDAVYDQYLKTHGIPEGMRSYSTIVRLVAAWKSSKFNRNLVEKYFIE